MTGAPKIRTMDIINRIEKQKRGIYSGAYIHVKSNHDIIFFSSLYLLILLIIKYCKTVNLFYNYVI